MRRVLSGVAAVRLLLVVLSVLLVLVEAVMVVARRADRRLRSHRATFSSGGAGSRRASGSRSRAGTVGASGASEWRRKAGIAAGEKLVRNAERAQLTANVMRSAGVLPVVPRAFLMSRLVCLVIMPGRRVARSA